MRPATASRSPLSYCIFERRYGEELGLDVEAGRAQRFRTMAGSFVAYEHEVTIQTLGIEFQSAGWADLVGLTAFESESLSMIACSC